MDENRLCPEQTSASMIQCRDIRIEERLSIQQTMCHENVLCASVIREGDVRIE
jgi:hypothetical protein